MALQDLWYSREADVDIGTAWTPVSTSDSLETDFNSNASGLDITGRCKDITISGGESDVDLINLFGDNQAMDEKRAALRTAEFTMIYQDEDVTELMYGSGSAVGTTGFNRVQGSDAAGCRTKRAILFHLEACDESGEEVNILMNNAYLISGDLSLAGDGSLEQTMNAKCLITDYYEEYKSS
jgi:hypothetical protein